MPENQEPARRLGQDDPLRGEFTEGKALTDDEIKRAGISREGTLGSIGYRIGRNAGETVISNMRNGTIDERQALWIADFAPGSDKVQAAGVRLAIEGASKGEILARMEAERALLNAQDEMGISGGTDLFGGALDNDEFNNFAAKYVNRKRNSLGQDISYLNKLVGGKLSKEQAKKYGIDIKDPDGLRKALDKRRLEQAEWQNPWVRRELMDEIRDAWKKEHPDGSGEVTTGGKSATGGKSGSGGASGTGGAGGTGGASMSVTEVKRGGKEPPVFKMLDLYHKGDLRGGGSFSVTEAREKKLFDKDGFMRASNGVLFDGTSFAFAAMHASPHYIKDAFRMDKEGTGEGDQIFGSGMYFTESDGVNDHYLWQFKKHEAPGWLVNGKRVEAGDLKKAVPGFRRAWKWGLDAFRGGNLLETIRNKMSETRKNIEACRQQAAMYEKGKFPEDIELGAKRTLARYPASERKGREKAMLEEHAASVKQAIAELEEILNEEGKFLAWAEEGNTLEWRDTVDEPAYNYRVEIDAEENELFYWDDKLGDEPNKGALEKMLNSPVEEVRELAAGADGYEGDMTGEEFYWALTDTMSYKHGLSGSRSDRAKAARYASEALLASGIKGHKYADGFTRDKPRDERKYNAVIWDMDAIKITHVARGNRDWKPREETGGSVGGVGGASMSVIGQRAKTFSKYLDKSFLGRDDGKIRAEIDASQARLTGERETSRPEDVNALLGRLAEGHEQIEQLFKFRGAWDRYLELIRNEARLTEKEKEELRGMKNWVPDTREELKALANRVLSEMGYDTAFTGRGAADRVEKLQTAALLSDVKTLKKYNRYRKDRARKLGEVLDYPELFEAYPELADIKVDGNEAHAIGSYDPATRTISLNNDRLSDSDKRRSVLLHEIQHAIQDIEGFASGSNVAEVGSKARRIEAVRKSLRTTSEGLKTLEALPEEIKNIDLRTNDGRKKIEDLKSKANQKYSNLAAEHRRKQSEEHRGPSPEELAEESALSEQVSAYNALLSPGRGWKNAEQIIDSLKKEIEQMRAQLRGAHGVRQGLSPYELYLRTPGEIEARNVETRRYWTAERRQ